MHTFLSFLPILFTIIMMTVVNQSAKRVLPMAWGLAASMACLAWDNSVTELLAFSIFGGLKAFDILVIIFGAIIILNTLKVSGAMGVINKRFFRHSRMIIVFRQSSLVLCLFRLSKGQRVLVRRQHWLHPYWLGWDFRLWQRLCLL